MKLNAKIKSIIIESICLLYVLLFVYAALSKLIDFENFRVQLGQSPLLSAFAGWVSSLVLLSEFLISILLFVPKIRIIALYLAVGLMTMFTTYIIIILNYSSFIPCSCGGILEKLGWREHLIFNCVFILIGIIALLLLNTFKKVIIPLSITSMVGVGIVIYCSLSPKILWLRKIHLSDDLINMP
jgi:hypothetical protein